MIRPETGAIHGANGFRRLRWGLPCFPGDNPDVYGAMVTPGASRMPGPPSFCSPSARKTIPACSSA